MSEVVEVNDIEELAGYRLLWNLLLPQTRGATFFQTLDWLQTYWKHYGAGQKLRVLIVSSCGSPIGIVPLTVISEQTRAGRVDVLTYPLKDWGSFYGPIGPNPTATLAAAMRHIRSTPRDWDMLDLRWTDTEGHDRRRTQRAMQFAGFQGREGRWTQTSIVDVDGTWEEYLASRTTKFRNNVRRCQRRTDELGDVKYVRYRPLGAAEGDDDPRWDLYDQCVGLAARSWQGSSQSGTTLSHESVRDFLRECHALAARNGMVDMNMLMLGGRVIAYAYNYHFQGRVYGMRVGYDPDLPRTGLGNVLFVATFEDSFHRGDRLYDLGPGSVEIKRPWTTRLATAYRYTHYPWAVPRSQVLRVKHWVNKRLALDVADAGKRGP